MWNHQMFALIVGHQSHISVIHLNVHTRRGYEGICDK